MYDGVFEVLQWLLFLSAVPPVQLLMGWCVTAKAPPDISAISALRGLTLSGTKTHVKGFWS
uniref:Mobile element protein n=1 Tax=Escherichia coli TaxID=562 RepID=A0A290FYK7_ECOLX|nr:Mobile element protein [Escherichia coli]